MYNLLAVALFVLPTDYEPVKDPPKPNVHQERQNADRPAHLAQVQGRWRYYPNYGWRWVPLPVVPPPVELEPPPAPIITLPFYYQPYTYPNYGYYYRYYRPYYGWRWYGGSWHWHGRPYR
jgi:hypothetical protein